jgi:hypothetical protein
MCAPARNSISCWENVDLRIPALASTLGTISLFGPTVVY